MRIRTCVVTVLLLFAVSDVAVAVPPINDNYLNAIHLNPVGPLQADIAGGVTNIEATTEASEAGALTCTKPNGVVNNFGSTVWYRFRPHVPGAISMNGQTLQFFLVIGLHPYDPASTLYGPGPCVVADAGGQAYFAPTYIEAREYLLQLGGVNGGQGNFDLGFHFDPDSDGDRWLDFVDECDQAQGPDALHGCPDGDGDSVRDLQDGAAAPDKCLREKGSPGRADGCLDSDGDNIIDRTDPCKQEDSRPRDANGNGCLDLAIENSKVRVFFRTAGNGIRIKQFKVLRLNKGSLVDVRCSRGCAREKRRAKGSSVTMRRIKGNRLRAGTRVLVWVTARGTVGRHYVVKISRGGYKPRERCLRPGSRKPTRNCNTVR